MGWFMDLGKPISAGWLIRREGGLSSPFKKEKSGQTVGRSGCVADCQTTSEPESRQPEWPEKNLGLKKDKTHRRCAIYLVTINNGALLRE